MKYLRILMVALLVVVVMIHCVDSCISKDSGKEDVSQVVDPAAEFLPSTDKPDRNDLLAKVTQLADTLSLKIIEGYPPYTVSLLIEDSLLKQVVFSNNDTIFSLGAFPNGTYKIAIKDDEGSAFEQSVSYTKLVVNCENNISEENLFNQVKDKVDQFHNYLGEIGDTIKRDRNSRQYNSFLDKIQNLFIGDSCTITINSGLKTNKLEIFTISSYVEKKIFLNPRYDRIKIDAADFHIIDDWTRDPNTKLLKAKFGYQLRYQGIQFATENRDIPVTVERIQYEDLNDREATVYLKTVECIINGERYDKGCCEVVLGNITTILPKI